jgi:alkanesulfonate monooxygenase SsuD/methylene tetrahydromethanopterin reductase-like flavin-dependent oxidoreductase (luciferase family)
MPIPRLGLQISNFTYPGVPDDRLFSRVADIATTAESSGFDSVWVMDNLHQIKGVGPRDHPILEAYTLLGALAARTERIALGAMFSQVTYRNPALLAKIVTTLDVISSGRAVLGIGEAWRDAEHTTYGYSFPDTDERMERLEDALRICRGMLAEPAATVAGTHCHVEDATNFPRPVTPGGLPILLSSGQDERTPVLAARYADGYTLAGDPAMLGRALDQLDGHCDAVGRDPGEVARIKVGPMVIGTTTEDARRKGEQLRAVMYGGTLDEETFRRFVLLGDPDTIGELVSAQLATGLDGLVVYLPDAHDLEPVELAGQVLSRLVGSTAATATATT